MRTTRLLALHALLPLILGGSVYLLWRPDTLLLFRWLEAFGLAPSVAHLRARAQVGADLLPFWAVYSLPHALWLYAFTFTMGTVWEGDRRPLRGAWLAVPPTAAIGSELAQMGGLLRGTFEWADIVACVLAAALALAALSLTQARPPRNEAIRSSPNSDVGGS